MVHGMEGLPSSMKRTLHPHCHSTKKCSQEWWKGINMGGFGGMSVIGTPEMASAPNMEKL